MAPDNFPSSELDGATRPGPMPWENPSLGPLARLWLTAGSAFHPVRDASKAAHGAVTPAARFALWSAIPMMALAGIIPYTRLFQFHSQSHVEITTVQDPTLLWLDLASAAGIGLAVWGMAWLVHALTYVTLLRPARGEPTENAPSTSLGAWRVVLYRAWMVPAANAVLFAFAWLGPEVNETRLLMLWLAFKILPCVVWMLHCSAGARELGSTGGRALMATVLPLLMYFMVLDGAEAAIHHSGYVPSPETQETSEQAKPGTAADQEASPQDPPAAPK